MDDLYEGKSFVVKVILLTPLACASTVFAMAAAQANGFDVMKYVTEGVSVTAVVIVTILFLRDRKSTLELFTKASEKSEERAIEVARQSEQRVQKIAERFAESQRGLADAYTHSVRHVAELGTQASGELRKAHAEASQRIVDAIDNGNNRLHDQLLKLTEKQAVMVDRLQQGGQGGQ